MNDRDEFLAIFEFQVGKPERLIKLIRHHVGKPLSQLLADFLATLVQGKPRVKRGRPKKRNEARDVGIAHMVARYREKEHLSFEEAVLQVADGTGLSEATIKRAFSRYSSTS